MTPLQQDEGWHPAIRGIFTWRVWRPGRSSVLARIRALWLVWFLWTPALVGVLHWLGEDEAVLARWMVWVGWSLIVLCALFVVATRRRLIGAAMALPEAALPRSLLILWARTLGFAMAPIGLAIGVVQAMLDSYQVVYPIDWAALVTLSMLVVIAPTVRRLHRVAEARSARDGVSVIAALSTPTIKLSNLKRTASRS